MDKLIGNHLRRIRTTVLKRYTERSISKWIEEHTTRAFEPFSYTDHEFQVDILNDDSKEINVRKCSQIGMSEVSVRRALARVNLLSPYTIAYTLPTSKFSTKFMKTRVDPVIQGSNEMKVAINHVNDNSEVKQFGDSFLYLMGASAGNAPISVPCDELIHDELNFCDQEIIGQYRSRLTHSKWKRVTRFSTPTIPKYGIDLAFQSSRRKFLLAKCNHCAHWFLPDYYEHVKIPDFMGDLREITKAMLPRIKWGQAAVVCPHCGDLPDLSYQNRERVCENPDEGHVASGHQVSPFDAPRIITPADLVEASCGYERIQDFINFGLGLSAEDREATLTREELLGLLVSAVPTSGMTYVMGVDVGNTYHFQIDAVAYNGDTLTVHVEQVPMGRVKERYAQLRQQYRIVNTVIDSGPHAETVMALQVTDPTLYAAVYTRVKGLLTYVVLDRESDADEGVEFVRQVNINRSRAFDGYMGHIRDGHRKILGMPDELRDLYITHHTSMKRVQVYSNVSEQMEYSWQKTDGNDHFHHAGLYAWIAGRMRGVTQGLAPLPVLDIFKFRMKTAA